jgi:hypothetical protein
LAVRAVLPLAGVPYERKLWLVSITRVAADAAAVLACVNLTHTATAPVAALASRVEIAQPRAGLAPGHIEANRPVIVAFSSDFGMKRRRIIVARLSVATALSAACSFSRALCSISFRGLTQLKSKKWYLSKGKMFYSLFYSG